MRDTKDRLNQAVIDLKREIGVIAAHVVLQTHAHFLAQESLGPIGKSTSGAACMCFFGTLNPNCRAHHRDELPKSAAIGVREMEHEADIQRISIKRPDHDIKCKCLVCWGRPWP